MNEHRNIEDFRVYNNKGVVIFFEDGSHTYIEPQLVGNIIEEVMMVSFNEIDGLDLPFPEED